MGINVPFISLVTDTGQVHINWVSEFIDYYLVPTTDTGFYLEERGIDKKKIKTLGFPVKQNFYQKFSQEKVRGKFEVPKGNKVVLYFSGAWGVGKVKDKVIAMDAEMEETTFLVVCGKNEKLQKSLFATKFKNDVKPLGFVDDVAEILAAADLVVSKAGGLSVMELITTKKPMVITEVTPGQEEPNARFIEFMGFGYVEKKPEELAQRVKYIFEYNDLSRLRRNLEEYHLNEHSDRDIANFIVGLTEDSEAKKFHLFNFFER
jgi:processive 1,2-diacylglycerol beta-glucosyltransferase